MRALIVDDESCRYSPDPLHALRAVRQDEPDVLLLQIHLPVASALELLATIADEFLPAVASITADGKFAVRTFEKSALDRPLEPVEKEPLAKIVERLVRARRAKALPDCARSEIKRIPCIGSQSMMFIPIAEVEYVKSSRAGVYAVTPSGEYHTDLTLNSLESRSGLLRCHKQYLVNVEHVREISRRYSSGAAITTKSRATVPVSRRCLSRIRAELHF